MLHIIFDIIDIFSNNFVFEELLITTGDNGNNLWMLQNILKIATTRWYARILSVYDHQFVSFN